MRLLGMNRSERSTTESEVAAQSRLATDVTRPGRHAELDRERIDRVRQALQHGGVDAVVCALPKNVLLLSGYWPVVGTSVAIATRDGRIALAVPADEAGLAEEGWADELLTFTPGSLRAMQRAGDAVRAPLSKLCQALRLGGCRVGFEAGEAVQESSYAAIHLYGASFGAVLAESAPDASWVAADDMLAELRAVLTPREGQAVSRACGIARTMFRDVRRHVRVGRTETASAAALRRSLATRAPGSARGDGFVYCMAGAHAALAAGAYARSRGDVTIASGDVVLVHCNSYLDGFWTDITRTYSVGPPEPRVRAMFDAIFEARDAALAALRPGVQAATVDRAARSVLERRGFGTKFTHSTGHGVGFAAIDHDAMPRLHPASHDVLTSGMVFNVEPAIYEPGVLGIRHCDVVLLEASGPRILTEFQTTLDELVLHESA